MGFFISFLSSYYILISISAIAAIIVSAIIADRKGRSIGAWIFGGLVLGWLAVIILACLSNQRSAPAPTRIIEKYYYHNEAEQSSSPTHHWRCHNCNHMITKDPCPFCGQDFS